MNILTPFEICPETRCGIELGSHETLTRVMVQFSASSVHCLANRNFNDYTDVPDLCVSRLHDQKGTSSHLSLAAAP